MLALADRSAYVIPFGVLSKDRAPSLAIDLRAALLGVGFIALYVVLARLGLQFAFYQRNATLIWAPSGLAVAFAWRYGLRAAPLVLVAAFVTNASIGESPNWLLALCIGLGNTLEAIVAHLMFRRSRLSEGLHRTRDVLWFLAIVVLAPVAASLNAGLSLMTLAHLPASKVIPTILIWWLGDAGGILVVASLIISFLRPGLTPSVSRSETTALSALGLGGIALAYGRLLPSVWMQLPIALLPFPSAVWAAGRFGVRGATAASAASALAAIVATARGSGPFHSGNVHVDLAMLWAFTAAMTAGSMLLASTVEEREREVIRRREGDRLLTIALGAGDAQAFERDMAHGTERRHTGDVDGEAWIADAETATQIEASDRQERHHAIAACQERGVDAWECEYRTRLGGELRWILERAEVTERDERGAPKRAVGLRRDVTERRRLDEQTRAEERDRERTNRLAELGMLAGGIAHDFNNLLMVVRMGIETARETNSQAEVRSGLRSADDAVARAAELTEQLLAYAGRRPLRRRAIDLGALTQETARLLGGSLAPDVTMHVDVEAPPARVEGDPTQLRQVVLNLLSNAVEAMQDRKGSIHVRVRVEGRDAILSVADEGQGMDASTRERVFEPFFTTKSRGRGLGLAAVAGIVRSHEGTLDVESELGRGSTFRVRLPYHETNEPILDPVSQPTLQTALDARKSLAVLVVDDEPAVRNATRRLLSVLGHRVEVAGSLDEALTVWTSRGPFDVALLDMTMPDASGLHVLEALRTRMPDVRAVLMSGYSEDLMSGRLPNGLPFLQKPFDRHALTKRLTEACE